MTTLRDMMDLRGTKFTIGAVYPPEKQKFLEDKLRESATARGIKTQGPTGQMGFVFTLDEALDYFTRMKEIQNRIEADEREKRAVGVKKDQPTPNDAN